MIINPYAFGGGGGGAIAASILSKMVAWWPQDETSGAAFADVHGGHNGTYTNSPTLSSSGVTFNGSNNYGSVADGAWAYLSDFTVGLRIKFTSTAAAKYILDNWTGSAGFAITTQSGGAGLMRGLIYTSASLNQINPTTAINDDVERIVMLTRVGTSLTFTISGVTDTVVTVSPNTLNDSTNPFTFGCNAAGGDYFAGRIAQSFFCNPLDSTERDYIINGGAFRDYDDLVALA